MSAQISIQNGKEEVFTAGKVAWHKLGVNVKNTVTWQEAAKVAHLDWTVSKRQLEYKGSLVDAYGTFRDDNNKFLGSCGNMYEPIQCKDAFSMCDALLTEGGAHYETAGALGNGEIIWTLARLPNNIKIEGTNDLSKTFLLFVDYRKQGKSAIVKLCMQRVVCNNTLNIALSENTDFFKIRHNGNIQGKIAEAKKLVSIAENDTKKLSEKLNLLAKTKVTKEIKKQYILSLFPAILTSSTQQTKAEKILELFESNDNNAVPKIKDTALNLLNATTQYIDHFSPVMLRNQDGTANIEMIKEKRRAEVCLFGNGDTFKNQALDNILSLVEGVTPKNNSISNILDSMNV